MKGNITVKQKVKLGIIGVGCRGTSLLGLLLQMDDVEIVGLCDVYKDRVDAAVKLITEKGKKAPKSSLDYRDILDIKNMDGVMIFSSWTSHVPIILDAMEAGKYAATEVGGACSIEQCWDLVRTYRRTGQPCMFLENACYGREIMTVLNMVRQGLFGELVHAEAGYRHDLRDEISLGHVKRHYRLDNYLHRNGDVYPTHDLGPIAKFMNINRGNRMLSLVSIASKSAGLNGWSQTNKGADQDYSHYRFPMGDVITTIIKCAHGETITLFHDTSLPRPYSRANRLQGSKGIWQEDKKDIYSIYLEGISPKHDAWDDFNDYYDRYEHPLWVKYRTEGVKAGHGGKDWLTLRAYVESAKRGEEPPIDVYDAASWMAVTTLSEDSVAMGGAPVAIPDFTNGAWINRKLPKKSMYSLDNWEV